jgi:hypothetical protein
MKTVLKYQTFDGELHDTKERAKRHLDDVYSAAIGKVGHALMDHALRPGYLKIAEYVDTHLNDFLKLKTIKDDYTLIDSTDEE